MGAFEDAVNDINTKIKPTMSNEELLKIYGLYKQATVGDCNIEKPGGRAGWCRLQTFQRLLSVKKEETK